MNLQIPVDIIENVVDYLWNHPNTLKTCAIVSHSFLDHCRRHLFSTIILHRSTLSLRLYTLVLSSQPKIALLIRTLEVFDAEDEEHWVIHDEYLPKILSFVDRLQSLTLSNISEPVGRRSVNFPNTLISSLFERLLSPSLTTLRLRCCPDLHVSKSFLANLNHLKELSIDLLDIIDDCPEPSSLVSIGLEGLEVLEILYKNRYWIESISPNVFPHMKRLLLLSIKAVDGPSMFVAHQVIKYSAGSLRSILLDCRSDGGS
jgi:hypothetical protein